MTVLDCVADAQKHGYKPGNRLTLIARQHRHWRCGRQPQTVSGPRPSPSLAEVVSTLCSRCAKTGRHDACFPVFAMVVQYDTWEFYQNGRGTWCWQCITGLTREITEGFDFASRNDCVADAMCHGYLLSDAVFVVEPPRTARDRAFTGHHNQEGASAHRRPPSLFRCFRCTDHHAVIQPPAKCRTCTHDS